MDTETLKTLYGSCKAYTMLLTDLLDENVQNFQYDINKEELKIAKFGMVSNIFLAIKEKLSLEPKITMKQRFFMKN